MSKYLVISSDCHAGLPNEQYRDWLDADGVVGEVIFPDADAVGAGASAPFGAGLGQSGDLDPTLLMAGARAHNRWLAELCADSRERRAGVAIVPILHDIDAAVTEIRRARESGLR